MKNETSNLRYGLSFVNLQSLVQGLDTDTLLVIVDQKVWQLYEGKFSFIKSLEDKGKRVLLWEAPQGEQSKNYKSYEECMEYFLAQGIHRNSRLIAIGGGALSDFAGFVASSLLRGISWSVIPTTLLAMIDASLGGKVAINSKSGKNLVGAFHWPENVWINFDFLNTLDVVDVDSGKGEIIKYAFLDRNIYELIVSRKETEEIIKACADYKMKIVEDDFEETHTRKILNLGHTFGHAFEKMYQVPHGIAVALGIEYLFEIFDQKDMLHRFVEVKKLLFEKETMKVSKQHDIQVMFDYLKKDKKIRKDGIIDLVLIEEVGRPVVSSFSLLELEEKVANFNMGL